MPNDISTNDAEDYLDVIARQKEERRKLPPSSAPNPVYGADLEKYLPKESDGYGCEGFW